MSQTPGDARRAVGASEVKLRKMRSVTVSLCLRVAASLCRCELGAALLPAVALRRCDAVTLQRCVSVSLPDRGTAGRGPVMWYVLTQCNSVQNRRNAVVAGFQRNRGTVSLRFRHCLQTRSLCPW